MALEAYRELVREVDELSERLFNRYKSNLECRRGCYFCCSSIAVLPVEHFVARRWHLRVSARSESALSESAATATIRGPARDRTAQGALPVAPGEEGARCAMLGGDGACTIYPARPVICRVHGLPLAYPLYEYDQAGRLLDGEERVDLWCDLNFTDLSEEAAPTFFDEHGRVDMVALNEKLEKINSSFLESQEGAPYTGVERLTLGEAPVEDT